MTRKTKTEGGSLVVVYSFY